MCILSFLILLSICRKILEDLNKKAEEEVVVEGDDDGNGTSSSTSPDSGISSAATDNNSGNGNGAAAADAGADDEDDDRDGIISIFVRDAYRVKVAGRSVIQISRIWIIFLGEIKKIFFIK